MKVLNVIYSKTLGKVIQYTLDFNQIIICTALGQAEAKFKGQAVKNF
jgi:hypothetical protein